MPKWPPVCNPGTVPLMSLAQALVPRVPPAKSRAPLPGFVAAEGERRGRVGT